MTGFFGRPKPQPELREHWLRTCLIQNESKLLKYVRSLTRDSEIAKDIVQDSFLKLWEQDHEKVSGHETQWLFTTCRNRAYDHLRKKERRHISSDEIELEVADPANSAEQNLANEDDAGRLKEIIAALTPGQREVLNMKFESGLSYKEISAVTGMSTSHVGVLIHNIVSKLKKGLNSREEGGADEV